MSRSASCLIALVALLAGFLATPDSARAHWENTRWGMTPAQVKALYPGAREEPPPADSSRRAPLLHVDGPIRAGNWEWAAIDFYFERDGKLSSVRLQPVVTNYSSGELYLSIFYGRALEITGTKDPAGRSVAAYSALHRDPKSGDEGTFEVFSLMGAQATSVRIEPADPDRVLRRQAMQRLKLLRDRGEAPLPQGGWNNTRWTMSREQVLALYPTARQDAYGRLHVTGPIAWQGRDWQEVAFDFKADYGLSAVMLWTSDDALAALEAEATARYGAPVRRYGAPPAGDPAAFYQVVLPRTGAGESVAVFSGRLGGDGGTGIDIHAPDDTAALEAAMAHPDPAPPPLALHWDMLPAEFLKLYPTATSNGPDSPFYTVMSPVLHGRTWTRGIFKFSYGDLDEYTLFSTDSFDSILAGLTSRYGEPVVHPVGSVPNYYFEDNASLSSFRVMRVHDGSAIMVVYRKG